jgi:hypothetical protein
MSDREDRVNEEYFIDTFGKDHKYKGTCDEELEDIISLHYEIALAMFPEMRNPDDYLMNLGWIQIGSNCYHNPIAHRYPTQAQINALDGMGDLNRLEILRDGYFIKYKLFDDM